MHCEVIALAVSAVSCLVGMWCISFHLQLFCFPVRFWRKYETEFWLHGLQQSGEAPAGGWRSPGLALQGPGASHWDCLGRGRWSACLWEVCARGRSVLPSWGAAGRDHQPVHHEQLQKETDAILSKTLQLHESKPRTTLKEMQAVSVIIELENGWRYGRAGSLLLLATGGKFLFHLQFCNYRIGLVLWLQMRDWKFFQWCIWGGWA